MKKLKKVLWIPAWFPHKDNTQLGNFYFQKAQAISSQVELIVVTFNRSPPENLSYDFEWINFSGKGIQRAIAAWRWYSYLRKVLPKMDCVHVFSYSPIFRLLSRLLKNQNIPFFFTEHWHGILSRDKSGISERMFFFKNAREIFTPSLQIAKALNDLGFKQTAVIPNIIDAGVKSAAPAPELEPYALMIADMVDEVKGIGEVIEEWQEVDSDLNLVLIGAGPDFSMLKQKAESASNIFFIGRKDQPSSMGYLHHAKFLIQNSRIETFGMVSLEALACGKPIIYRKVGLLKELDLKGVGVEIKSTGVAQAVNNLIQSMHEFSPDALKKLARPFNEGAITEKLLSQYFKDYP
ncbi:MAG: glycosyltransferase family 4 protein [Cryomorphaceae bacterium]